MWEELGKNLERGFSCKHRIRHDHRCLREERVRKSIFPFWKKLQDKQHPCFSTADMQSLRWPSTWHWCVASKTALDQRKSIKGTHTHTQRERAHLKCTRVCVEKNTTPFCSRKVCATGGPHYHHTAPQQSSSPPSQASVLVHDINKFFMLDWFRIK